MDLPNHDGQTLALKGSVRDVKLVVSKRHANINCADKRGTSTLIAAVENGRHDVCWPRGEEAADEAVLRSYC